VLIAFVIVVAFAGAAFGSFAGVVASRGLRASISGRSRCGNCGRTLRWYETVPIVSYLALRGHCRTCHAPVGIGVYAWEVGGLLVGLAVAVPIAVALRAPAL
jgi:leader peptidase (prepilin peptidase) / N-methyltransferase